MSFDELTTLLSAEDKYLMILVIMAKEEEEMEIDVKVMEVVEVPILLHINTLHTHQIRISRISFLQHRLKVPRLRDQPVKSVERLVILPLTAIIGWTMLFKGSILLQS